MLRMTTIQNLFKTLYIKDNKCKREAYQKLFETRVNWVQWMNEFLEQLVKGPTTACRQEVR